MNVRTRERASITFGGSRNAVTDPKSTTIPASSLKHLSQLEGGQSSVFIMVVEDNPADVALLEESLREHGVEGTLLVARDGEKALEFVRAISADGDAQYPVLVILDLNLPKVRGNDVLRQLRLSPRWQSIPVVILSSSNAESDRRMAAELGANAYISKPSNLDDFLAVGKQIRTMLA